jgi:hypothetical protein
LRPIDPNRLKDSYVALLAGITPEQRKAIWVAAREMYPSVAEHLWTHFSSIDEGKGFEHYRDRIGGAMFMFLAMVNATADRPIVTGPVSPHALPRMGATFPQFGNLPSLE